MIATVIPLDGGYMTVSSRTPEGQPNSCPICDGTINIEPSEPFGDAPCPSCGQLLWFARRRDGVMCYDSTTAESKKITDQKIHSTTARRRDRKNPRKHS